MKKSLKTVIIFSLILCLCMSVGCAEEKQHSKKDKTEIYSATASIIAISSTTTESNDKNTITESDLSTSLYLADTIVELLKTPEIYDKLADELGDNYNAVDLKEKIVVARQSDDGLIININVYSEDADEAILIANKFAEISCEYVPEYFPNAILKLASVATKAKKSTFSIK